MLVGILLVALLVACYSCIDIGNNKNGSKGIAVHFCDKNVYLGVANLSDDSYKSLNVNGRLTANNIKVKKGARVMGEATIVDSKFADLNIMGRASLTNLTVTDKLKIMGKADLNDGTYGEIVLHGQKFKLANIVADSITLKDVDSDSKKAKQQYLNLTNCKISGDVICKASNCDLIMDQNTKIAGKIIGFNGFK